MHPRVEHLPTIPPSWKTQNPPIPSKKQHEATKIIATPCRRVISKRARKFDSGEVGIPLACKRARTHARSIEIGEERGRRVTKRLPRFGATNPSNPDFRESRRARAREAKGHRVSAKRAARSRAVSINGDRRAPATLAKRWHAHTNSPPV